MASQTADSEARDAQSAQPPTDGQAAAASAQITLDSSWSQVWQLPVLLLGLGLLGFGVWLALPSSKPPDLGQALDDAGAYLKADNLNQAKASLETVQDHQNLASADQLGRMDAYFGDLTHHQLHKLNPANVQQAVADKTNQQIVDWYHKAEKDYGYPLTPRQLTRLAQAMVSLGQNDQALELVDRFDKDQPARRYGIIRRLIDNQLARIERGQAKPTSLTPLIERFEDELAHQTDQAAKRRQQIWIAAVRAKRRLLAGAPDQAIDLLNRRMIRLFRPGDQSDLAPLYVMLGQANQRTEHFDTALKHYGVAQTMIESTDPLNAHILVGQARIRLRRGGLDSDDGRENLFRALHLFKTAVHDFPSIDSPNRPPGPNARDGTAGSTEPDNRALVVNLFGSAHLKALVGQADTEARIGQDQAAAKDFSKAVAEIDRNPPSRASRGAQPQSQTRRRLRNIVFTHAAKAHANGAYFRELDLLKRLAPLFADKPSVEFLQRLALAHEALANQHLADAAKSVPGPIHRPSGASAQGRPASAEPVTQASKPLALNHQSASANDTSAANSPQLADSSPAANQIAADGSQPGGASKTSVQSLASSPEKASAKQNSANGPAQNNADQGKRTGQSSTVAQAIAGQTANDSDDSKPAWYSPNDQARRLHNQQAAIHFGKAAGLYLKLARKVTITRDALHGHALWKAARDYERAQNWKKAISAYRQFVHTRIEDPRLLQARHRLAKAYLADGQTAPAIKLFNNLIQRHPKAKWATLSLSPLAQAYLQSDQRAQARATLIKATNNHPAITPDSAVYRRALIQLGKLYYRMGRDKPQYYIDAIQTLSEAVSRYGKTAAAPTLRYLLADSNRLSIKKLDQKLDANHADRRRIELQSERMRRLEQAQMYYNQAITELEDRPKGELDPLKQTYLRNAYFYQADCAFDLRHFEEAIDLYKAAARRWEKDPASLVAHVQIFNAYCELGRFKAAKVANKRALWHLNRIPEKTFDNDPTLPMSRKNWEDWLRWNSELQLANANDTQ